MSQPPSWLAQPQPQHPSKMPLPKTTGRVIVKITLYFVGAILADLSLLGGVGQATGLNTVLDCTTFSVSFVALIGSIILFFRREYYRYCLPARQYLWWVLGATGTFVILFVILFTVSNPNKNLMASVLVCATLVLYGLSFMWIAHLKPPVAQQVNESVSHILNSMPGKQIDASDLLARLQKKYKEGNAALHQYLDNLEYLERVHIPSASGLTYRMKQQKPVAPLSSPQKTISHSPVTFSPLPPQVPGMPVVTPQPSQANSLPTLKSENVQRSLADVETTRLPIAIPNPPPLSSSSSPQSTKRDTSLPQRLPSPHPKPADPVLPPPDQVVPSTPSVSPPPQAAPSSAKEQKVIQIFCCYAHEDERLLGKLKTHLKPQQRQGLIQIWHDRVRWYRLSRQKSTNFESKLSRKEKSLRIRGAIDGHGRFIVQ